MDDQTRQQRIELLLNLPVVGFIPFSPSLFEVSFLDKEQFLRYSRIFWLRQAIVGGVK